MRQSILVVNFLETPALLTQPNIFSRIPWNFAAVASRQIPSKSVDSKSLTLTYLNVLAVEKSRVDINNICKFYIQNIYIIHI